MATLSKEDAPYLQKKENKFSDEFKTALNTERIEASIENELNKHVYKQNEIISRKIIKERASFILEHLESDTSTVEDELSHLRGLLESIIITDGIPADCVSVGTSPNTRCIRSIGCSFLGHPEIVMEFSTSLSGAAEGIYRDLKCMILSSPIEANEKLRVGRKVIAARFTCVYEIFDALYDNNNSNFNGIWVILKTIIPKFSAVNIVIQSMQCGMSTIDCSKCSIELPKNHKCCPCHAVAYCSKECQISDWPKHKLFCSTIRSSKVEEIAKEYRNARKMYKECE